MHKIYRDKAQSSQKQLDAEMLGVVPPEGTWLYPLTARGVYCFYNGKTNAENYFSLLPVFVKAKSSSDFFLLAKAGTSSHLL